MQYFLVLFFMLNKMCLLCIYMWINVCVCVFSCRKCMVQSIRIHTFHLETISRFNHKETQQKIDKKIKRKTEPNETQAHFMFIFREFMMHYHHIVDIGSERESESGSKTDNIQCQRRKKGSRGNELGSCLACIYFNFVGSNFIRCHQIGILLKASNEFILSSSLSLSLIRYGSHQVHSFKK